MTVPSVITLLRREGMWCACFDGPLGDQVLKHFGTRTLPTSYADTVPYAVVSREIAIRNPGALVREVADVQ